MWLRNWVINVWVPSVVILVAMRWLLVEILYYLLLGSGVFCFEGESKGLGLVWFGLMDVILGVVVMWTGRRRQPCGVVVVVFLQISGGRCL
jgi:hypothetical protein